MQSKRRCRTSVSRNPSEGQPKTLCRTNRQEKTPYFLIRVGRSLKERDSVQNRVKELHAILLKD
jgi:hypothetical protein